MRVQDDPRLTTAQHDASWEVWSAAWDAARDADTAAGRRYDKDRYHEAATMARRAFLQECLAALRYVVRSSSTLEGVFYDQESADGYAAELRALGATDIKITPES